MKDGAVLIHGTYDDIISKGFNFREISATAEADDQECHQDQGGLDGHNDEQGEEECQVKEAAVLLEDVEAQLADSPVNGNVDNVNSSSSSSSGNDNDNTVSSEGASPSVAAPSSSAEASLPEPEAAVPDPATDSPPSASLTVEADLASSESAPEQAGPVASSSAASAPASASASDVAIPTPSSTSSTSVPPAKPAAVLALRKESGATAAATAPNLAPRKGSGAVAAPQTKAVVAAAPGAAVASPSISKGRLTMEEEKGVGELGGGVPCFDRLLLCGVASLVALENLDSSRKEKEPSRQCSNDPRYFSPLLSEYYLLPTLPAPSQHSHT